jgi:predicted small lipoprotein YifL
MNRHWTVKLRPARVSRDGSGAGLSAVVLAAALLAGCGQKGPLWVPGYPKNTPWPMKPAGSGDSAPAPVPAKPAPPATPDESGSTKGAQ